MGIESDQLVYDYLSRVGDLAQRRELPEDDRVRLVSTLRDEIDRRRETEGVREILGALGTPDEVVDRGGAVPAPRQPDWWSTVTDTDEIPGFRGGIERPDLFFTPEEEADGKAPKENPEPEPEPEPEPKRAAGWRVLRSRKRQGEPLVEAPPEDTPDPPADRPRPRLPLANPFVLLAALLLLGGAVFGSLLALAAGWLLAYASRRLTPGETRTAVLAIPGLAVTAGVVWIWGRADGRWGEAIAEGGPAMGSAIGETWPWVVRGAAVGSALFLVWRAGRK